MWRSEQVMRTVRAHASRFLDSYRRNVHAAHELVALVRTVLYLSGCSVVQKPWIRAATQSAANRTRITVIAHPLPELQGAPQTGPELVFTPQAPLGDLP